ncbi:TetR/AcrR family transcriptional regulator [Nocardiopsis sp. NPDC058789]|uniref:TetR family transcriptional regulator n=1 Tax=Nocardiopsis eucommiae TaxID=2831970 RepID=A0A975QHW2_9ACTN|nr:TetR family transcriptional regulator [Nocardiopsis eucommiae]
MTSEERTTTGTTREIDLLWGLRETPRRGPKPRLSRTAVVDAAVEVADAEGLEAVSMQRVARELGYTTMSLYRHVDSKEDLILLMLDAAMTDRPAGPREDGDWRAGVEEWCHGALAQYRRHPWAAYVPQSGPPSGPHGLRWMEAGLREVSASGLDAPESLQILLLLTYSLRDLFRMEQDLTRAARERGVPMEEGENAWVRGLRRVMDPEEFPTILWTLDQGTFTADPPGYAEDQGPLGGLDFAVQRILDGVEAYVRSGRKGGAEHPAPGRS